MKFIQEEIFLKEGCEDNENLPEGWLKEDKYVEELKNLRNRTEITIYEDKEPMLEG